VRAWHIFIDELDAIGRQRGVHAGVVNDEREQTRTFGAIGSARSDAGGDMAARCPYRAKQARSGGGRGAEQYGAQVVNGTAFQPLWT